MGQNLTGQLISATYESLVQISGSIITDGTGSDITSLDITASNAVSALSANSASVATSASFANTSTSASYALSASYVANATIDSGSFMITGSVTSNILTFTKGDGSQFSLTVNTGSSGGTINTGSLLVTASISNATITFTKGDASTFGITVNNVLNATSASFATNASTANSALTATSASHAVNSDLAITASYALNVTPINTGSFYVSSSVNNATITFIQGDGTTEAVTVNNVLNATSASFATTAGSAGSATTATSASHAINADTASLALNIVNGLSPTFNNITVTNTASFGYVQSITGSAVYIGDSFIAVNTDSPALRYAGIKVFDSGSSPIASASLEWDSLTDTWIAMEETGNTAVMITGPTGSRGSETYLSVNKIQKGLGWNYIGDSSITDDGTTVSINANTNVTGSVTATAGFTGSLNGNADTATSASYAATASYVINPSAVFPYTGNAGITGNLNLTGSYNRLSGSFSGSAIDNITDIYTTTTAIQHVVSLTQAEYNTISGSASPNTLYYITDAPSFVTSASYAVSASHAVTSNTATTALTATSASFATTALNATSASFATTAASASYVLLATSASFATTATSASYALTASFLPDAAFLSANNTFIADQIIQSASLTINGPVYGGVSPLTISSNTASMDLTANNFFTLTLVSGSNTYINPTNIVQGQTINLRITQANPGNGTVSFPTSVKQVSGSAYVPTAGSGPVDIVTFIAFDATNLYLSNVKNLV